MRQPRTGLLPCLALVFTVACAGARPAEPAALAPAKPTESTPASQPVDADFLSISRPGSSYQARWSQVSVAPGSGGFRTDLFAKAASDGEELVEAHFVIIRLHGPGEYPLGFGWDRGQSRVTLRTREGMNCMAPGSDAGVIEFTSAPAGEVLAPGDRLEGRYRVHCFPDAKASAGQQPLVFTGAFAVTVRKR
jgi:hypothetical protein